MADTKDKRAKLKEQFLKEYHARVKEAGSNIVPLSLGDDALELVIDFMLNQPKEATRTKTFRFPADILDWLEEDAAKFRRSPNAHLIAILERERTASNK